MSDQEQSQQEHRAALVRGLVAQLHEARRDKDQPAVAAIVAALNEHDPQRGWRLGGKPFAQRDELDVDEVLDADERDGIQR